MRDLAVQSLNATNSAQDRADLDQQFQQLKADINNVAQTAQFNGVNLLDGTFQGATFQIGANAGKTITVASVASACRRTSAQLYNDGAGGCRHRARSMPATPYTLNYTDGAGNVSNYRPSSRSPATPRPT